MAPARAMDQQKEEKGPAVSRTRLEKKNSDRPKKPDKINKAGSAEQRKQVPSETAAPGQVRKPEKRTARRKYPNPTPRLSISRAAFQRLKMVAVAYSEVDREFFPTDEAYEAEKEVIERAQNVHEALERLGITARLYEAGAHFLTDLLVDRPDLVLNLVDTLRGKDALQTSVPGALELVDIPYTGAGMRGLVIGNDRNLLKQILTATNVPTPDYQFIRRVGTKVNPELGVPLIVKLNESGGSVGIDNNAVKETIEDAQKQVDELINTYHIPVVVEQFIDGPEITVVLFEDSRKKHVFMGKKRFGVKPDGKHEFTSIESYNDPNAYHYDPVEDEALAGKIEQYATRAFTSLHNKDYVKYDIRVDEKSGIPYFTDCNPNTAFGPHIGLPFTEIIETLYGLKFEKVLEALISKYAKKIKTDR